MSERQKQFENDRSGGIGDGAVAEEDDVPPAVKSVETGPRSNVLTSSRKAGPGSGGGDDLLDNAVNALARDHPEFSARESLWAWQRNFLVSLVVMLAIALWIAPGATVAVLFAVLAIPFVFVSGLRVLALWTLIGGAGSTSSLASGAPKYPAIENSDLPSYAILVPLFREAHVVPNLIAALERIDYPRHLLEISLIVESIDAPTREALDQVVLASHMRIVVVPDGQPRTKPRALNYALYTARGEYVVVFDAEDVPEPDQLLRVVARLEANPEWLGCVQARLNVYNPKQSWLTRQFAIEYTGLFDAILPALERIDIPLPLGGTSNHFPRHVLESVGGWDPFNVTEDADLGIRLARAGWRIGVLNTTTWEEAPTDFHNWLGQRTRWLKGWMQTYLVHLREPRRLLRELGLKRFLGLQVLMGALILSCLIHPLFYLTLAWALVVGGEPANPQALGATWFFWIGMFNLFVGYLSAMALGALSVMARNWPSLVLHCLLMPFYWLLISFAAYRALWQLSHSPHFWEKTEHAGGEVWPLSLDEPQETQPHMR